MNIIRVNKCEYKKKRNEQNTTKNPQRKWELNIINSHAPNVEAALHFIKTKQRTTRHEKVIEVPI